MKKKFNITGIVWETDGEHIDCLPDSLIVVCNDEDEIADCLSDITGWLVSSIGSIEEIKVTDMAGHELSVGDTICFTLSMRKDQKPIVRARIKDFVYAKKTDYQGQYQDRIVPEYIECPMVKWGRNENKLPETVRPNRVVKCY